MYLYVCVQCHDVRIIVHIINMYKKILYNIYIYIYIYMLVQ